MNKGKPVLALVGRPNVGKSTLFNRLIGQRTAIVKDTPGTTRDRIYGESDWNGKGFIVIDTGGLEENPAPEADSAIFMPYIRNQATLAMQEADVIAFVVDSKDGPTAADEDVADILRLTNKPVFLVVNKVESEERQLETYSFWDLGLGEPIPISAFHGIGVGDFLDLMVEELPDFSIDHEYDEDEPDTIGVAIVGRPNVGKSSLLNCLIGDDRSIVSDIAGTTRDPIDFELTYHKQKITLIDTAGVRRRGKVEPGIERFSVIRSMRAIDRADVALLLIDAQEGVTAQDAHVASYILDRYKGVVVIVNKWDLIEKDSYTMIEFEKKVRTDLKFLDYVPLMFISAETGQRIHRVLPTALEVAHARYHRLGTSEFNNLLRKAYDKFPPPSKAGRRLRIYYGTQPSSAPPTFAIFVNDPELLHFSYERYLHNQIREHHPFIGTPIRTFFRGRGKEKG
ncbi:MAG: ribosome biogenesis GTPase Der [Chloroflexota bacterium]